MGGFTAPIGRRQVPGPGRLQACSSHLDSQRLTGAARGSGYQDEPSNFIIFYPSNGNGNGTLVTCCALAELCRQLCLCLTGLAGQAK